MRKIANLALLTCCLISVSKHELTPAARAQYANAENTTKQVDPKIQNQAEKLAPELINNYYTHLQETGSPTGTIGRPRADDSAAIERVKALLDKNILVQRADGDFFNYDDYRPVDIDEFNIRNVVATMPRKDLIVSTYEISTPDATSLTRGTVGSPDYMPRITTFRYDPNSQKWLILSHASFNVPIKQICNYSASAMTKPRETTHNNSSNIREAMALVERLFQEVQMHGSAIASKGKLITKETQIVSGDGYARTGDTKARRISMSSNQTRDYVVTSDANDLVVRFEAKTASQIGGVEFRKDWQPRLATFSRDKFGEWTLASYALFNYPYAPPAGSECIIEK